MKRLILFFVFVALAGAAGLAVFHAVGRDSAIWRLTENAKSEQAIAMATAAPEPPLGEGGDDPVPTENGHDHAEETAAGEGSASGEPPQGGHNEKSDTVHLSREQLEQLDIRVGRVRSGAANSVIELPATVAFDLDRVTKIGPRLTAKVVRITKDLGETVSEGDKVAVLESVELGKAKGQYLMAQARVETERANYEREKKLAAQAISSEASLLEARARYREAQAKYQAAVEELRLYGLSTNQIKGIKAGQERPLSIYALASPQAGVLQKRALAPGQTISPQETPIHVVDTGRMWVFAEAFERDLAALAPGQSATITVDALPGESFAGTVDWISAELDRKTRTARLRIAVENRDRLLRAGMFATARIRTARPDTANRPLVPVDAVQTVDGRKVVFIPEDEEGAFRAVPVNLGEEADGWVEVEKGLDPRQRIVQAGAFDLMAALTAAGRSAAHSH